MKITIYELLGLVKDGKAPKKIKYKDIVFNYTKRNREGLIYIADEYSNYEDNDNSLLPHLFWHIEKLNDEVEIIEEPKKIEKISRCDDVKMTHYDELYKPTENEEILRIKINKLIDEINNLKEK